jgi:hypothetical protein
MKKNIYENFPASTSLSSFPSMIRRASAIAAISLSKLLTIYSKNITLEYFCPDPIMSIFSNVGRPTSTILAKLFQKIGANIISLAKMI